MKETPPHGAGTSFEQDVNAGPHLSAASEPARLVRSVRA